MDKTSGEGIFAFFLSPRLKGWLYATCVKKRAALTTSIVYAANTRPFILYS